MADVSGVDNLSSSSNGSTSLTGIKAAVDNLNTAKQEKGSGVTGNIPTFGSSNVLGDSGLTPPASTIVGRTDTQTLTNKTLTSPAITNPSTTGTDSGVETLTNKTIAGGSNTISGITEAMQTLADNTTGNVSTAAHGYAPKAPNDATKFLRGDATWAAPTVNAQSYASAFTSVSSTTTQNIDSTFTTTFQPAVITVYFKISGYENFGGELHFTRGIAVFAGTTVKNVVNFYSDSNNTTLAITAATLTDSQANPTIGNNTQTGNISATLSIQSVSPTNFVVRVAFSANGTPPAVAAVCTFNAVATQ